MQVSLELQNGPVCVPGLLTLQLNLMADLGMYVNQMSKLSG